jgi:hypothetical protein
LEPFDDDHAPAAAGAGMLWFFRLGRMGVDGLDGIDGNDWWHQQFASACDVLGALGGGEEAIVADAVDACCRFRFRCGTGGFSRGFFGFNWDWKLAPVPIETKNSAPSGENGLSLKCGFPALHIRVADLLLPRSNRFHGELVEMLKTFAVMPSVACVSVRKL